MQSILNVVFRVLQDPYHGRPLFVRRIALWPESVKMVTSHPVSSLLSPLNTIDYHVTELVAIIIYRVEQPDRNIQAPLRGDKLVEPRTKVETRTERIHFIVKDFRCTLCVPLIIYMTLFIRVLCWL
jgi:hypothetical protein